MHNPSPKIFFRFTTHLKQALETAEKISRRRKHSFIDIEHILYGIMAQKGSVAFTILKEKKATPDILKKFLEETPPKKQWQGTISPEIKIVFKKAVVMAGQYNYKYVGTEHILFALLNPLNSKQEKIFKKAKIDILEIKKHLEALFETNARFPDTEQILDFIARPQKDFIKKQTAGNLPKEKKPSALDYFCVDLTSQAEQNLLDAVIGRDEEIKKIINILGRKTKNNPILIGDAGVGKTAIVNGLAQRIVKDQIPESLSGKRIFSLDLGLVVSGTVFRGEFEARLKDILFEVQDNPDVILFIDEIHTIVGAGSASGSLDAANILKPALSQGQVQCIGATTSEEFRKYFRKDSALERRFQPIIVKEPDRKETLEILSGLCESYEKYHNLSITEEAIESAVSLSERFIPDRFQPDKAIDLIDEAASLVKSQRGGINYLKEIRKKYKEKKEIAFQKEEVVAKEQYEEALKLKEREESLESEIKRLKEKQKNQISRNPKGFVKSEDVAKIVSDFAGIPAAKLISSEKKKLGNLEKLLSSEIIGQDNAILALSSAIRRARAKIANPLRPEGSFIFLGPTGVGKTELAKILALKVYGEKNALIKIDMSEFMEQASVSKLIGSSPGYVGYEDGGKLTEKIRLQPYSVILFDEIEKAHPDIFNILLQVLEDGELTDAAGRKVNFKNTTIIMTSNIGTESFTEEARMGFDDGNFPRKKTKEEIKEEFRKIENKTIEELKEIFRPELFNRIDKVIVFNPLDILSIKKITRLQLNLLKKRLVEEKIKIDYTSKLADFISEKSFDPNQGARLVRRNIENFIENPLAEKIINDGFDEKKLIRADIRNEKVILK